jgi:L-lactate dehydrogenase complex protein LldG
MSGAREEMLIRIASAIGQPRREPVVTRDYRSSGALDHADRVELFCRRVGEYRADVHRLCEADIPAQVTSICAELGARKVAVPAGIPTRWRASAVEVVEDDGLSAAELDGLDGAFTGCTAAIAETGTIILTASPLEGRRAITLVPDLHICAVRESQIVQLLPEALALIAADRLERRPITFISGPSATSDIELSRVEGVHGPRTLVVLVIKERQ